MRFDYTERTNRLKTSMMNRGIDTVVLSSGADLPYFVGYEAPPSERLTALVVTATRDPVLIVPQLEAPRVEEQDFEVRPWSETEDPIGLVAAIAGSPETVAIGDHTWSVFLIGLQKRWPDVTWLPASTLTRELRMRKDRLEVEALRRAARAVDIVMGRIAAEVPFSGRTEREVARHISEMTVEEGHDSTEFTIVASGPNGASPHHEPGGRVIEEGDLVVCDFGGRWDGYYSDSTRTFSVGEPSVGHVEIHEIVRAANEAARSAVAPGVPCQEVDESARAVIEEAGFGEQFLHRTGHGIGLEVHEHPYILKGNELRLEPGMTFSVEPGIYVPDRFGIRIEDIVACTEDGVDTLNQADRGLAVVV